MADTQDRIQDRASEEATDWLILLQDSPEDMNLYRRFRDWLVADPAHAAAWRETETAAGIIATAPPAHAERWGLFLIRNRSASRIAPGNAVAPSPNVARPRFGRRRALQLAGLAAAACLALLVAPDAIVHLRADHVTGTAEMRTIPLSDGSTILLAPGSAVAIDYSPGERRVELLAGEAFFTAAPNPERPFRVAAGDVRATVLGTRFDVRRGGEGTSVAVEEGSVRVENPSAAPPVTQRLEAGQSVRITWDGTVVRQQRPPAEVAASRRGRIVAQDRPMADVIGQLRRYYGGTIVVADFALGSRTVTGVYNLADPEDALRAVARAHGATVRRISPWLLIVSRL